MSPSRKSRYVSRREFMDHGKFFQHPGEESGVGDLDCCICGDRHIEPGETYYVYAGKRAHIRCVEEIFRVKFGGD